MVVMIVDFVIVGVVVGSWGYCVVLCVWLVWFDWVLFGGGWY